MIYFDQDLDFLPDQGEVIRAETYVLAMEGSSGCPLTDMAVEGRYSRDVAELGDAGARRKVRLEFAAVGPIKRSGIIRDAVL